MVWWLTRLEDSESSQLVNERIRHPFLCGVHKVGKKCEDLEIADDASVSRKHATITIKFDPETQGDPKKPPSFVLWDWNSKYGTHVERDGEEKFRITGDTEIKHDDIITFGRMHSVFKVTYEPIVVTTSCLPKAEALRLKQLLMMLGGHLVSEWLPSCTHLVMTQITVTLKVVCALLSGKPIVDLSYFEKMAAAIEQKIDVPDTNRFLPDLAENGLADVVFAPSRLRANMFCGKTFAFLSEKQFNKMRSAIEIGGGRSVHILSLNSRELQNLKEPGTIVVNCSSSDPGASRAQEVSQYLMKHKKRLIPESEIGYSVLYGSTSKYCNPSSDLASVLMGSQPQIVDTQSMQVVPDSMDISSSVSFIMPTGQRIEVQSSISSSGASFIMPTPTPVPQKTSRVKITARKRLPSSDNTDDYEAFQQPLAKQRKRQKSGDSDQSGIASSSAGWLTSTPVRRSEPNLNESIDVAHQGGLQSDISLDLMGDDQHTVIESSVRSSVNTPTSQPITPMPKPVLVQPRSADGWLSKPETDGAIRVKPEPGSCVDVTVNAGVTTSKIVIKTFALVPQIRINPTTTSPQPNSPLRNFKPFRKVQPLTCSPSNIILRENTKAHAHMQQIEDQFPDDKSPLKFNAYDRKAGAKQLPEDEEENPFDY